MDLLIEQNARGKLEIKQQAFNKLLKTLIFSSLAPSQSKGLKDLEVLSELNPDRNFYILVKFVLKTPVTFKFNEAAIINEIEMIATQIIGLKPRNIALAYQRK